MGKTARGRGRAARRAGNRAPAERPTRPRPSRPSQRPRNPSRRPKSRSRRRKRARALVSDPLKAALGKVAARLGAADAAFVVERPRDAGHGDLATNLAMVLAKTRRANPRKVAEEVLAALELPAGLVAKTEIAGPGFINFWLGDAALAASLTEIVRAGPG